MNFGLGRAHSSDAWSNRRSLDYSSRMHSVPRYNKSSSKYSGNAYPYSAYDDDADETPWNCPCNSQSMSGECSHRCSSLDRVKTKQDSKEFKKKMVFVLHDEIKKPSLTFPLEEISDINVITEMCLNTMAAMLRSKTHRKFLYHRNNNASLIDEELGNRTGNSIFEADPKKKDTTRTSVKTEHDSIIKRKSALVKKDLSLGVEEYSKAAELKRKHREEEIMALRNLKEKLPPKKRKSKGIVPETTRRKSSGSADKGASSIARKSWTSETSGEIANKVKAEMEWKESQKKIPLDEYEKRKTITLMTPEEALHCKWLRLSDKQIENFEERIRAEGKDPGIHNHSRKGVEAVFEKDGKSNEGDDMVVTFSLEEDDKPRTSFHFK